MPCGFISVALAWLWFQLGAIPSLTLMRMCALDSLIVNSLIVSALGIDLLYAGQSPINAKGSITLKPSTGKWIAVGIDHTKVCLSSCASVSWISTVTICFPVYALCIYDMLYNVHIHTAAHIWVFSTAAICLSQIFISLGCHCWCKTVGFLLI